MSGSLERPWSDHPNAPQVPHSVYSMEKENFVANSIAAVLYGIVIILFFQCMSALLSLDNRTRGKKWGFVAHTVAMFSVSTMHTALNLNFRSIFYIDNREFPGADGIPPGPLGYDQLQLNAMDTILVAMFPLNQWLADGLLLHRCSVIYSTNYGVMAFPCLIYLASVALGVMYIYQESQWSTSGINGTAVGTSYFSIALSLNIILTFMIVARLVLHSRGVRKTLGARDGVTGLYTAVITTLVESYALYAVAFLLYIVPWALDSPVVGITSRILGPIQVIAPYLVVLRVANRKALTSEAISRSSKISSLHFESQATTLDGDESGDPTIWTGANGDVLGAPAAGGENIINWTPRDRAEKGLDASTPR